MIPRERRTMRSGWVQRERIDGGFANVNATGDIITSVGSIASTLLVIVP
jgi:hypothetical protein